MSAMRKSSLIEGMFRRDITEYPRESLRESIANAVAHRDYSPYVRGSYIQIRMFADRLEVRSPGGLFGNVTVIPQSYPDDTRSHILAESIFPPSAQRSSTVGLVYLRQHSHIDNRDYRRLNHVGMTAAGQDLRGMVQTGFVEQTGFGRWTKYILKVQEQRAEEPKTPSHEETILAHVKKHGSINNTECRDLLEIDLNKASYLLKKLAKKGILKQSGKRRWTRYRLS